MASWQANTTRDPLFDKTTQAALSRRARELGGAALLVLATIIGMLLFSYSPDDPSFLTATDQPATNLLGRPGAYIAAPLMMIAGIGAWALVVAAVAWGLRLLIHRGEERFMRALFVPMLLALASTYAATQVPPSQWKATYGMGGHFGDMALGTVLRLIPLDPAPALKVLTLLIALALVALAAFSLGFNRAELQAIARFLRNGLVTAGRLAAQLVGKGAGAAKKARAKASERRDRRRIEPDLVAGDLSATATSTQSSLPRYDESMPLPELVEDEMRGTDEYAVDTGHLDPAIVSARIQSAVAAQADVPKASILKSVTARLSGREPDQVPFGADTERHIIEPTKSAAVPASRQAMAEAEPQLGLGEAPLGFERPPLSLLSQPDHEAAPPISREAMLENARMLEAVLDDYGVKGEITEVRPGPVVTLYELEPAPGLKASRVIGLSDDIARSMSALSARVSTVPGRSVIGIELPNETREKVLLREILAARAFGDSRVPLPLALGKDIGGEPIVANLAKMPHLLIAGTTGSGKSVAINTMILSLLYKLTPEECRLIMIDPKMLELSVYDGIPHLLSPVVTDPKKAVVALKWVVGEMEDRYRKMSKLGVRNIEGYNHRVREALSKGELFKRTVQTGFDDDTGEPVFETDEFAPETVPYIVVIVDEMADLMMVAGKEIEACIQRLAQMARASGIHLIMATQRPSVDVITGTIKANFPTRISFQVTSKIDSRTILGEQGAEQLLGQGDMLYMAGGSKITRVHGPFVSDEEVEEIVTHLKSFGPPQYMSGVVDGPENEKVDDINAILGLGNSGDGDDQLYDQAVQIVAKDRKCSTSYIQRKLAIGYNKAARIVEMMETNGVVSPANHVGKRDVLVPEV